STTSFVIVVEKSAVDVERERRPQARAVEGAGNDGDAVRSRLESEAGDEGTGTLSRDGLLAWRTVANADGDDDVLDRPFVPQNVVAGDGHDRWTGAFRIGREPHMPCIFDLHGVGRRLALGAESRDELRGDPGFHLHRHFDGSATLLDEVP